MAKQSQSKKVSQFLQQYPNQKFNARAIAEAIVSLHPEDYAEKRSNPRFKDDKAFITQIVAEIGVILLNPENPSESEMTLPARARTDVDWESTNRILSENVDFKDYIELVSTYYQTGRIRARDWNKV